MQSLRAFRVSANGQLPESGLISRNSSHTSVSCDIDLRLKSINDVYNLQYFGYLIDLFKVTYIGLQILFLAYVTIC